MQVASIQSPKKIYEFLTSCEGDALQEALSHLTTECLAILNTWIAHELHDRLLPEREGLAH